MDNNNQLVDQTQWINKLPSELLSRIFVLGEGMQRGPRMSGHPYVGLQDVVTQVCGHWRHVAIDTPKLWTYIYVSHPPPHHHAQLYISRSGTCHLDIDIEMKTPYNNGIDTFDFEQRVVSMRSTVRLIIEYGGTLDRWRSLIVFADGPRVISEMIACINTAATLALRFLLLLREWRYYYHGTPELDAAEQARRDKLDQSLSHGLKRPQLRHVELHGLPGDFIFNRASPITEFAKPCLSPYFTCAHLAITKANAAEPTIGFSPCSLRYVLNLFDSTLNLLCRYCFAHSHHRRS